jgi:hypothetical protein
MGKGARLARRTVVYQRPDRRVSPRQWAVTAIAAVLLAVAAMVAIRVIGGAPAPSQAQQPAGSAAEVLRLLSALPAATFDTVGLGKVDALPKPITGQSALTDAGKPLVVYVGAEYCPFCAAQRWPVVLALLRFGTFTGLSTTHSASADVYANTATLSFHGASYTSQWLTFQGVETNSNIRQGNGYAPLDTPTDAHQQLLRVYDAPPYVPTESAGAIPFIDLGNLYLSSGASFGPQLLEGKTAEQIAAALANPDDPITRAVVGSANAFTAVLCQLTKGQPGNVCSSPAVTSYQDKLHG